MNQRAAFVADSMRHWLHFGIVLFYLAVLLSYTGVAHATNYTHYTRYDGMVDSACQYLKSLRWWAIQVDMVWFIWTWSI